MASPLWSRKPRELSDSIEMSSAKQSGGVGGGLETESPLHMHVLADVLVLVLVLAAVWESSH